MKCYEENKAGTSDWGALLYRVVSKGLFNELTLEQKLNDMKARITYKSWGRTFQPEQTVNVRVLVNLLYFPIMFVTQPSKDVPA